MDRHQAMRTLVQVADSGNFSAASRELGVTPASVSKTIGRLEEELGAQLFHRTTRVLAITDAGREYVARCRQILSDIEEADEALKARVGRPLGVLRVTAPVLFGRRRVMPAVTAFMQRWPSVRVEVLWTDAMVDLVNSGLDLAIRLAYDLPDSSLQGRRVGLVRRCLVASPRYLEEHGAPERVEALRAHRCLMRRREHDVQPWSLGELVLEPGGGFQPALTGDTESLCDAALAGAGIADLPDYLVRPWLETGELVRLLEGLGATQGVWLLQPSRKFVPARVTAFVAFLMEALAEGGRGH